MGTVGGAGVVGLLNPKVQIVQSRFREAFERIAAALSKSVVADGFQPKSS